MTDDDMQKLRDNVVAMCNEMVEQYDWDSAFAKYLEAQ